MNDESVSRGGSKRFDSGLESKHKNLRDRFQVSTVRDMQRRRRERQREEGREVKKGRRKRYKNWPVRWGERGRSRARDLSQRETKNNTRRFSFENVAVAVRFPPSHVIYVKHREVASRCAQSSFVRTFVRSTFRLLVWDANHAAFSAVRPTAARGPTFCSPFAPLFSPAVPRVPITHSLSLSLPRVSQSRSAKMHLRMHTTLLLSLQYSIVSNVIYERRRGRKEREDDPYIFILYTTH